MNIAAIYVMINSIIFNNTVGYVKTANGWKPTSTEWEVVVGSFDIDDDTGKPCFFDWYSGKDLQKAIDTYNNDGHYKADDISVYVDGRYEHTVSEALRKLADQNT